MGIGHWELGIFAIAFSYTIFCVRLFAIYVNTIAFFTMMLYSQHPSRGDAIARTRKIVLILFVFQIHTIDLNSLFKLNGQNLS